MKIGITYTGRDDKHANYVNWIKGGDHSIDIVKLAPGEKADVTALDGVVLSGGVDIHPSYFNGEENYQHMPSKFWKERDDFEFNIFKTSVANKTPVLGVCRGLQLINVAQGGTLIQDLDRLNEVHRDTREDKRHVVRVENNSMLSDIVKEHSGVVNSAHHQSIKSVGDNLIANSYADDGTIEGIEWKKKDGLPFMLAVQWHPERMDKAGIMDSPFSKNIRDYFLTAVRSNQQK